MDPPSHARLSPVPFAVNRINKKEKEKEKEREREREKREGRKREDILKYMELALNILHLSELIIFISFCNLSVNPASIDPPPHTKIYTSTKEIKYGRRCSR